MLSQRHTSTEKMENKTCLVSSIWYKAKLEERENSKCLSLPGFEYWLPAPAENMQQSLQSRNGMEWGGINDINTCNQHLQISNTAYEHKFCND